MALKAKKKKSGIHMFAALLLMVVIAAFVYKFIIVPVNNQIFDKKDDRKASLHSYLKIIRNSSDGKTTPDLSGKKEPASTVFISLDKLSSPNAILIRLNDYTVLMQKNFQYLSLRVI